MIIVSSIWSIESALETYSPSHMISILNPGAHMKTPKRVKNRDHFRVEFDDVDVCNPWDKYPTQNHMEQILEFGRKAIKDGHPVLIHCTAGVSRSPAAALILAASLTKLSMSDLVKVLREKAPYCRPNWLMVELGEQLLGLNSELSDALRQSKPSDLPSSPEPFVLNVI